MSVLSGTAFKEQYGNQFYKFLNRNLTHHGYQYQMGLNVDTEPFSPSGSCEKGGLYFTDLKNVLEFYAYGPQIGIIEIPDDAKVYVESEKFKADRIVISKIVSEENDIINIFKQVLEMYHGESTVYPWNAYTCADAAQNGHLEVLKWLRENGCPWDGGTSLEAMEYGHLEVLKWAGENGCPWDVRTCCVVAQKGHLEILQWVRANGCPWDKWTCSAAALNGHLGVLQWARKNGCPWDEDTCSAAASNGHLEVLQWARENGCPWDKEQCASYAARWGHLEVLKWINCSE